MSVKIHTPGQVRYFRFQCEFPDGDTRWYSREFVHDLMFELKNLGIYLGQIGVVDHPAFERELLVKGEYRWTDLGKRKWLLRVENDKVPDNWL